MLRTNFAILRGGFKTGIAYRLNYIVNLFSVPLSLIIYYFLWKSIFEFSNAITIKGFTLQEMVSYYALAMIVAFFAWSDVDSWIEEDVIEGNMIAALLKPASYFAYSIYFQFGMNSLAFFVEILPVLIIGALLGLRPSSVGNILLFLVAVAIAVMIYFLISYLIGLSAFWLKRISGLKRVKRLTVAFLSGSMIPLTFFPDALQKIFVYLPFQYVRFTPVNIYLNKYTFLQSLGYIGIGLVWVFALYFLSAYIWKRAFKKFAGSGA